MVRLLYTFLILLCLILPAALFMVIHERLIVSPDELVIVRRGVFGTNTIRLQANEIEEVEIARDTLVRLPGYVVVRRDRGSVKLLTAAYSAKELKWLKDTLVHVLTSAPS